MICPWLFPSFTLFSFSFSSIPPRPQLFFPPFLSQLVLPLSLSVFAFVKPRSILLADFVLLTLLPKTCLFLPLTLSPPSLLISNGQSWPSFLVSCFPSHFFTLLFRSSEPYSFFLHLNVWPFFFRSPAPFSFLFAFFFPRPVCLFLRFRSPPTPQPSPPPFDRALPHSFPAEAACAYPPSLPWPRIISLWFPHAFTFAPCTQRFAFSLFPPLPRYLVLPFS